MELAYYAEKVGDTQQKLNIIYIDLCEDGGKSTTHWARLTQSVDYSNYKYT